MADAVYVRETHEYRLTADNAVAIGELWQVPTGLAGRFLGSSTLGGNPAAAANSGDTVTFSTGQQVTLTKTSGFVALPGNRAYWDHSANAVNYKKVNDRDFYVGRFVADAASADTTCVVAMNVDPPYDVDIARDPHATTIVGTQALGGLGIYRRGGAHHLILSSTSEAQKLDMLSIDGWAASTSAANAIVEMAFRVVSDGAGTAVDVSLGIANATHATDADSITESLFVHLDANNVNINLESDDGTTEVAATDTTIDYTEGSSLSERVEVWFDMRNPADVQCYVNGSLVLGATTFDVDAAVGPWKLLAHIEKTSSTDTYELALDWLRAHFSEQ